MDFNLYTYKYKYRHKYRYTFEIHRDNIIIDNNFDTRFGLYRIYHINLNDTERFMGITKSFRWLIDSENSNKFFTL